MSLSLTQGVPALQREIKALKKQLRRAEEDHEVALGKAGRQNREALDQAQRYLGRANEDLQDAKDTLAQTLDANRLLAQQVEESLQRSQASAQESSELREELEQLEKQHQLDLQDAWTLREKLRLHQETTIEVHRQSQEKIERMNYLAKALQDIAQAFRVEKDSLAQLFTLALAVSDTADEPEGGEAGHPQPAPLLQLEDSPSHEGEDQRDPATSDVPTSARENLTYGLDKIAQKMEVAGTSVELQASSQARIDRQTEREGVQGWSSGANSPLPSSDFVIPNQNICEGSRSDHGAEMREKEGSSINGSCSAASQSSPLQLNDHPTGPAVASSFGHISEDGPIQADNSGSHGTRSIVRGVSRDSSHLNKPHGTGTIYWFRDVVHGTLHGQTNHASADAVRDEVECFLNAGIRPDQITVMAWSHGQTGVIKWKLRQINPCIGRADDVHVVFVEDFGGGESDVIIADLVMADERTHHSDYVSQEGDSKSYKATKTRKILMARAKDPLNLKKGFAQARHGFVMIGQSNWLIRWPKFVGLTDKHSYAEIVRDAWRRKVYIRDATHRDTHANVVQKLRDLGSVEVSRRAAVADAAHLEFFERLINAGPKISRISLPKEDKQATALQRAQADEDQARLQQRAAERLQTEEDLWQEAHDEEDS